MIHLDVPPNSSLTVTADYDEPYDVLVIRDDTGIVARFEELRGDIIYIEFLETLLDVYDPKKIAEMVIIQARRDALHGDKHAKLDALRYLRSVEYESHYKQSLST